MGGRDRVHDLAFDDLVRQFASGPVVDRTVGFRGRFASDRDDLSELLGGELSRTAGTGGIRENGQDGLPQGGGRFLTFDEDQPGKGFGPDNAPVADLMAFQPNAFGDLLVDHAGEGQQDDGGSLSLANGSRPRVLDGPKDLLLPFADDYLSGLPWHDRVSLYWPCGWALWRT